MLSINRAVEIKSSMEWLKLSFVTFREKPLQFIILGIVSSIIGLIPGFGAFLTPLFNAKFAQLTARVERNQPVLMSMLFENLFANKNVVRLAFINLCIATIIFTLQYFVENYLGGISLDSSSAAADAITIHGSLTTLLYVIPMMILQLSMWMSPLICLYNQDISPFQAMWLSIKACGVNIVTMLFYSLLVLFFSILAIIPFGLGLFIWLPMLNIVSYFIYKSLFVYSRTII
ncbi:MAG: hypothetical protein QG673_1868 [Pseudomonadota bacterium]|nr:hypothetical protein [Pseudomonadota bacterium]